MTLGQLASQHPILFVAMILACLVPTLWGLATIIREERRFRRIIKSLDDAETVRMKLNNRQIKELTRQVIRGKQA